MNKHFFQHFFKNMDSINLMIGLIFLYPILKGFIMKFSSKHLKEEVNGVESNIAFVVSIALSIHWMKNIFFNHIKDIYKKIYALIPRSFQLYVMNKPIVVYLVIIPITIFIVYNIIMFILKAINSITFYPLFDGIEKKIRDKGAGIKRVLGAIFQIPKSICYVIILAFILNFISMFNVSKNLNAHLQKSKYYNYICKEVIIPVNNSKVAKKLPNIMNNSFKIVIKNNDRNGKLSPINNINNSPKKVVYYNGVTLDEGVKSNVEINNFARNLVRGCRTDREKAKVIYKWIGTHISYDNEKAKKVFENSFNVQSGSIPTFRTRRGICFDYSCLFVSMCRANNLKVRLITGRGFNGVSWVGHAWNQVYLKNEGKWVNVDTTFEKGGDYFDSNRFILDHADASIAGQWN